MPPSNALRMGGAGQVVASAERAPKEVEDKKFPQVTLGGAVKLMAGGSPSGLM